MLHYAKFVTLFSHESRAVANYKQAYELARCLREESDRLSPCPLWCIQHDV